MGIHTIKGNRFLIGAAYFFALVVILSPSGEALLTLQPFRISDTSWRFAAVGMVTQILITPFLGLAVLAGVAYLAEHRLVLRGLSLALFGLAGILFSASVMFSLDTLELRGLVGEEGKRQYDMAALLGLLRLGSFGVLSALAGIGIWSFGRSEKKVRKRSRATSGGLVRPADSTRPASTAVKSAT